MFLACVCVFVLCMYVCVCMCVKDDLHEPSDSVQHVLQQLHPGAPQHCHGNLQPDLCDWAHPAPQPQCQQAAADTAGWVKVASQINIKLWGVALVCARVRDCHFNTLYLVPVISKLKLRMFGSLPTCLCLCVHACVVIVTSFKDLQKRNRQLFQTIPPMLHKSIWNFIKEYPFQFNEVLRNYYGSMEREFSAIPLSPFHPRPCPTLFFPFSSHIHSTTPPNLPNRPPFPSRCLSHVFLGVFPPRNLHSETVVV